MYANLKFYFSNCDSFLCDFFSSFICFLPSLAFFIRSFHPFFFGFLLLFFACSFFSFTLPSFLPSFLFRLSSFLSSLANSRLPLWIIPFSLISYLLFIFCFNNTFLIFYHIFRTRLDSLYS